MIFVDSNIIIDVVDRTGPWSAWSRTAIVSHDRLVTNAIVLAETAPRFRSAEQQIDFMDEIAIKLAPIDAAVSFMAGKAHYEYRQRGGPRDAIVADFLIGAHASVIGATLLTRDRQRFASYFPELALISPETHP